MFYANVTCGEAYVRVNNPIVICFNPNVTGRNYNVTGKNSIVTCFEANVTCFGAIVNTFQSTAGLDVSIAAIISPLNILPFGETEIEVLERYRISLNNTGSQPGIAEIIDEFGYGRESLRKPGQDWTTPSAHHRKVFF